MGGKKGKGPWGARPLTGEDIVQKKVPANHIMKKKHTNGAKKKGSAKERGTKNKRGRNQDCR